MAGEGFSALRLRLDLRAIGKGPFVLEIDTIGPALRESVPTRARGLHLRCFCTVDIATVKIATADIATADIAFIIALLFLGRLILVLNIYARLLRVVPVLVYLYVGRTLA